MFFYLKISCKDKRIFNKFLLFFAKLEPLPIRLKSFPKPEKRKFVTVLKSPHVNKTAQEQFEYRFYSKHFLVQSFKPLTFFLLLKKLKNFSFPGINIEVQGLFEKNKTKQCTLEIINPDNITLKNINNGYLSKKRLQMDRRNKILIEESKGHESIFLLSKKYIQLFDLYGEICLKKVFYS